MVTKDHQEINSRQLVELGISKYQYIFGAIESIEAKSGALLGFLGIVLTIAFTGSKSVFGSVLILNIISGGCFLAAGICLLFALMVKDYRTDPDIFSFAKTHLNASLLDFNKQLISNISDSVSENLKNLEKKSAWFNRALIGLSAGVGSLLLSHIEIVIKIFCKG